MLKYYNITFIFIFLSISVFGQSTDYLKAFALYRMNKNQEVLNQINTLNEKEKNLEIQILKGKALRNLDLKDQAIDVFLQVEKQKPGMASFELSKTYAIEGNTGEAIRYLEKHISSRYKLPRKEIRLDNAFKNIENNQEWMDFWKQDHYSKRENLISEIKYLLEKENYWEALDLIDSNLKKSKKNHSLYYYRGIVFDNLDNEKPALKNYDKAISINKRQPEYYLSRANSYLHQQKNNHALRDINKYIELEPTNFEAYKQKAEILIDLEKYEEVIDFCKFYLKLFPGEKEMSMHYALANEKVGNYNVAIETYSKLMKENKPDADVYFARGNTNLTFEKLKNAIYDYSMALDLNPNNPEIYLNRGTARFRKGDSDGACVDWKKAAQKGDQQANKNLYYYCK